MDRWDCVLYSVLIFGLVLGGFTYILRYNNENADLWEKMDDMRGYAGDIQPVSLYMDELPQGMDFLLVEEKDGVMTKAELRKGDDTWAGYATMYDGQGYIVLNSDMNNKVGVLAHEYAHQVMFSEGNFKDHHDDAKFIYWENCLFFSASMDVDLCK